MAKVYAGDTGTLIRLDVGTNVNGANVEIRVLMDEATFIWPAVANGNYVEYITKGTAEDIAKPGKYKLQAYVDMGTWHGLGETVTLRVYDQFK